MYTCVFASAFNVYNATSFEDPVVYFIFSLNKISVSGYTQMIDHCPERNLEKYTVIVLN